MTFQPETLDCQSNPKMACNIT